MREMDKGVGELMALLQRLKIDDNTFVMFFSDNGATGPGSCGDLYGMKGTLWEGGHRVPGIARWPGQIAAGTETSQLASTIDVMPTILDLVNADHQPERPLDGMSLVKVLTQQEKYSNRTMFWQYGAAASMRQGRWKLIVNGGKRLKQKNTPNINWDRPEDHRETVALFDLGVDPGEHVNLANKHPDRVREMQRELDAWKVDVTANATRQPDLSSSSALDRK